MSKFRGLVLLFLLGLTAAVAGEPTAFYFDMVRVPATGFWVSKYEVTQAEYLEISGENPSRFPDLRHPVESVSWEDATDFCKRLTERERSAYRLPPDLSYALPTDAQWDAFAGATDLKDATTSLTTPHDGTDAVGRHTANAYGLYDVVGNVWEWCQDWYDNRIRKQDSNRDLPYVPSDAEAAANGTERTFKVLRGGAWDTVAADGFSLSSRLRYAPGMSNYHTGFRCVVVRTVPLPASTIDN